MSGFTYSTLSITIPYYNFLIDHIEDIIDNKKKNNENNESDDNNENENNNENNELKQAAKVCKNKLLEYYNKTNNTYLIATILDPRLKLEYYQNNNWRNELIDNIKNK